jgi:hypothetical protein
MVLSCKYLRFSWGGLLYISIVIDKFAIQCGIIWTAVIGLEHGEINKVRNRTVKNPTRKCKLSSINKFFKTLEIWQTLSLKSCTWPQGVLNPGVLKPVYNYGLWWLFFYLSYYYDPLCYNFIVYNYIHHTWITCLNKNAIGIRKF